MVGWRQLLKFASTALFGLAMTGAALAEDTVTIGYSGPLSGGAALYGKNALSGIEFAVKEINATGGVMVDGKSYKLTVVALDDKYSPSESAVNAKRLRTQYNAPVIFVPHSGGIYALQAFNEQDGFLIGAYTSTPKATESGNKLTFRIPPAFDGYFAPFIAAEMKTGKKLGMAGADHDYAKAWSKLFGDAWKKAGGTIVAENPMSYNKDTDFYSGVSRVLAADPDVLFVGGASEPTALVVKQARELGFKGGVVVMDQAKLDEMAQTLGGYELIENAVGTLPLVADARPAAKNFVVSYRKEYNRDPGGEAANNYGAMQGIAMAMKAAGSVTDAKAIRAKLDEVFKAYPADKNPSMIAGVDANGGSQVAVVVGLVKNGKIEAIDSAATR